MMNNTSVPIHYIVTDGDYVDCHITAVFSKKEDAEKYIQIRGGIIEEWEESFTPDPSTFYRYEAILDRAGNLRYIGKIVPASDAQIDECWFEPTVNQVIPWTDGNVYDTSFYPLYGESRRNNERLFMRARSIKALTWPSVYSSYTYDSTPEDGYEQINDKIPGIKVYGKTKEAAVKIAAEKWAEARAIMGDNLWIEVAACVTS